MGRPIRRTDTDPGWVNRELRALRRDVAELRAAKRLPGSTFPPGIIPTSSLKSPAAPGYVSLLTSGFAVDLIGGYAVDESVSVPDLFTSCVIALTGRVYALNSTVTDDYLLARVEIDAVTGTALPVHATPSGTPGSGQVNVCAISTVITDLSVGDTFPIRLFVGTAGADWAADPDNVAELTGSIVWFA